MFEIVQRFNITILMELMSDVKACMHVWHIATVFSASTHNAFRIMKMICGELASVCIIRAVSLKWMTVHFHSTSVIQPCTWICFQCLHYAAAYS